MSADESPELDSPWEQLREFTASSDPTGAAEFLASLTPANAVVAVLRLDEASRSQLLAVLDPKHAAQLIDGLPDAQAATVVETLEPARAAAIVQKLPSNEQADLIGDLTEHDAKAILDALTPEEAKSIRALSDYPDDVAGGLMITEMLAYPAASSVSEVLQDLRNNADAYRDFSIQYAFVVDSTSRLQGVLRLRDLLLAKPQMTMAELMIADPITVGPECVLDDLREVFEAHRFLGVPVVSSAGELLGVVQRNAVDEALGDRIEDDYLKSQGIIREELRTMPTLVRSRRRLAWLSINIGLNVVAASVIAAYQNTLAQVIALAVFLPIISDMSGCSGNQAVAVSMRELSLGLVKPWELTRVLFKELSVGLLNGAALGVLLGMAAYLWQGNPYLGLVIGGQHHFGGMHWRIAAVDHEDSGARSRACLRADSDHRDGYVRILTRSQSGVGSAPEACQLTLAFPYTGGEALLPLRCNPVTAAPLCVLAIANPLFHRFL